MKRVKIINKQYYYKVNKDSLKTINISVLYVFPYYAAGIRLEMWYVILTILWFIDLNLLNTSLKWMMETSVRIYIFR